MTIKFQGHVDSIATGLPGRAALTLIADHNVCHTDPIVLTPTKAEADVYRPGMQVEFTVIPIEPKA